MPLGSILIIDDETRLRGVYAKLLHYEGYSVIEAEDGKKGIEVIKANRHLDLILCDVRLPDYSGLDLIQALKAIDSFPEIILVTAYGTIPDGVEAMRRGAFDYLTKGDSDDQLLLKVEKGIASAQKRRQQEAVKSGKGKQARFEDLIGTSPVYRRAVEMAKAVAATDAAVLLLGETGTGKELFAQAIHTASPRAGKAFVSINCAALPRETLESELFGHAKGSFTGAVTEKKGLLETAAEGTLFLDEIGELPLDLQAKLLRFLESGEYYRLGETKQRHVDARVVSATNRNLDEEAKAGRFRQDLYYRLAVIAIELPPLRMRGSQDVLALAEYYLTHFAQKLNKPKPAMNAMARERLFAYGWPGNVRELRNVIERVSILNTSGEVPTEMLPAGGLSGHPAQAEPNGEEGIDFNLQSMEKRMIRQALDFTERNKTQAARILGIGLTTLYRKMAEYGLEG